jgi:hypothetical protein
MDCMRKGIMQMYEVLSAISGWKKVKVKRIAA